MSNYCLAKSFCITYSGMPIVKVGCGSDFSMILDCGGVIHSFGMPDNGRLGEFNSFIFLTKVFCTELAKNLKLFIMNLDIDHNFLKVSIIKMNYLKLNYS